MTPSESQGRKALSAAMKLPADSKTTAIVRLFAIAMVFYRQPIGDLAWEGLHILMGVEETSALAFISGFSVGGAGARWEQLVPWEKE